MKEDTKSNFKKFLFLRIYNEISSFNSSRNDNKYSIDRRDFVIKRRNFYIQKLQLHLISSFRYAKKPSYDNQNFGFFYLRNSYSKSYMHRDFVQIAQFSDNDLHNIEKINHLADKFTKIVIHFFD